MRRLLKNTWLQNVGAFLAYRYLWFVFHTSHFDIQGDNYYADFVQQKKSVILPFFHGRLAMMPFLWTFSYPFRMLLSDHSDGHLIAKVIKHHGIDCVYGSSTRKGAVALLALLRHLKEGTCIGITPDGPKGPHQSVSKGVIRLAQRSGVPIIAATFSIKRCRILKTWDHFMFPLPFSRGVFVIDTPLVIDAGDLNETALEQYCHILQTRMIALEQKADAWIASH